MSAGSIGGRLTAAALAVAAGVSAGLATGIAGALATAAAVPTRNAALSVSPDHGAPDQGFTASYSLGRPCGPNARVRFEWDRNGPFIDGNGVPVIDVARCATQAQLIPPVDPGVSAPGAHVLLAAVANGPATAYIAGSVAQAAYMIDPGPGGTTSTASTSATPPPTPTPTPRPTPTPSALPLYPVSSSFPPHDCRNDVPDGPTPCPAPTGGGEAIAGSAPASPAALPAIPAAAAGSGGSGTGSGPSATLLMGMVALVAMTASLLGWWAGGRQRRIRAAAGPRPASRRAVDALLAGAALDPPAPRHLRGPAPPPPSASKET